MFTTIGRVAIYLESESKKVKLLEEDAYIYKSENYNTGRAGIYFKSTSESLQILGE